MKEIGGYFGLDNFNCDSEYYNALDLNSGRNALAYLIQARKIKRIYLPYYICDSVKNTCVAYHVEIIFYTLTDKFEPDFTQINNPDIFLYLVNYYGLISNKKISDIFKRHKKIIVDNVQAFFQKPVGGIDTIYSCRKFFGVPDGSYLFTSASLEQDLLIDDSTKRLSHLIGRSNFSANQYYGDYLKNEKLIDSLALMRMSKTTHNLLMKIDYKKCKRQRTINFNYLHEKLQNINLLKIDRAITGAFAYPLIVSDGDNLRKFLISKNIYVPTLWPNTKEKQAEFFSLNILPLPCDHRYRTKDMNYIIECIIEYENYIS